MNNIKNLNRRQFLKLLARGGTAGALGTIGGVSFLKEAVADTPDFSDYKALVCIYCDGGNDSFNMLLPTQAQRYANYRDGRASIAVSDTDLNLAAVSTDIKNGTLGKGSANPYNVNLKEDTAYLKGYYDLSAKGINLGVNGVMPELAQLITDNKATIIANTGTLIEPTTRSSILNKSANLPVFLFAHNHQRRILETGQAAVLETTGWAGKLADEWSQINNNSSLGLNMSYASNSSLMKGKYSRAMALNNNPRFYSQMRNSFNSENDTRRAIFRALSGFPAEASSSQIAFDSLPHTNDNPFKRLFGAISESSMSSIDTLTHAWESNTVTYASTGSYGEDLFSQLTGSDVGFDQTANSTLFSNLETVAKMIDLGVKDAFASGKYNRQIFLVDLGGFDTHSGQVNNHPLLLRELSLGLWKFQKALEELGHEKKVTTFSMSDFGRTMSINGDGTDHGWGGHQIVMGGAGDNTSGNLNGGKIIGDLPDLTVGGPDDYSDKGRIIPTTSQDQVNATICKWFGVEESFISTMFPNLSNFETTPGDISSAMLDDLFV